MTGPVESAASRAAQLRQFVVLDIATTTIAGVAMMALRLLFDNNLLPIAALLVWTAAGIMALALRPLARGELGAAVMWVAVANWGVAIAAAGIAPFSWPIQSLAALLPAVMAVPYVSRRRYRGILAASVAASSTAAGLGLFLEVDRSLEDLPSWLPPTVVVVAMPFMAVLMTTGASGSATILRGLLDESLAANRRLRESEARVVAAGDAERQRIERDLHDGAQQHLVALGLQISLAQRQAEADPSAAHETLEEMRANVNLTRVNMRRIVRGLHPPVLTQHGLAAAIRAVMAQIDGAVVDVVDDIGRCQPAIEAALYFCCVEALQNTMKHTPPDAVVTVELGWDEPAEEIVLRISDDGPGLDGERSNGAGLINMADRVRAIGGSLRVVGSAQGGTLVEARVPQPASRTPRR